MTANLKPALHDCEDIVPPSQIGWGEGLWSGGHQMTEVSGGHQMTEVSGGHQMTEVSGGHQMTVVSGACLSRGELALHEVHVILPEWLGSPG